MNVYIFSLRKDLYNDFFVNLSIRYKENSFILQFNDDFILKVRYSYGRKFENIKK